VRAAAKAKLQHNATAKELEEETKRAMGTAEHAFLKEKMDGSKSK
jgi:hypothetical protein